MLLVSLTGRINSKATVCTQIVTPVCVHTLDKHAGVELPVKNHMQSLG